MSHLAKAAELNIFIYPKEGLMMHALWIIFFSHLKRLVPSSELKYQTVQSFLESYGGKFDCHTTDDQKLLCETANWMNSNDEVAEQELAFQFEAYNAQEFANSELASETESWMNSNGEVADPELALQLRVIRLEHLTGAAPA